MLISELLVLATSGRRLLYKRYRHDVQQGTVEAYCTKLVDQTETKPISSQDGVHFAHIRRGGLYLLAVSVHEAPSVCVLEFLTRLYHILKDFCGVVNEESVDDNIVLLYEVLDEIIDYGYIQLAATEKIKPFIHSDPVIHRSQEMKQHGLFGIEQTIIPGSPEGRTVIASRTQQELRKNEVYVDVVEKITATIDKNGVCERCEVQGEVLVKCFTMCSPSALIVALNEDLVVDAHTLRGYGEMARLAECSYHSCVDQQQQQHPQTLVLHAAPEGQFCVMSYRVGGELPHGLPIRLHTRLDTEDSNAELSLCLRCPVATAVNVTVTIPVPHNTQCTGHRVGGEQQHVDFSPSQHAVIWTIKTLQGETTAALKLHCISAPIDINQLGPVQLDFELSNFVCSNLKIRNIKMVDSTGGSIVPLSYIRYITTRDSYVYKLS